VGWGWGFDYEVTVLVGRNGFAFRYLVVEDLCRRAITRAVSRSTPMDAFRDGYNLASNHILEVLSRNWGTRALSAA
jgi:hypothetical protein